MAYVQVPKDLRRVKTKVLFNLTKRQLICFSLAAAVGIPLYLLVKAAIGSTLAASLMILVMLPFFLFAMYEKDGRPLEVILKNIWNAKVRRPGVRIYETRNFYGMIQEEIYNKEVLGIGSDVQKKKAAARGGKKTRAHLRKNEGGGRT